MSQETIKIRYHHPTSRHIHALFNGSNTPICTTYFSKGRIYLMDKDGKRQEEFPFDKQHTHKSQSYEIILEAARKLNQEKNRTVIDETVHPPIDITSKL